MMKVERDFWYKPIAKNRSHRTQKKPQKRLET